MYHPYRPGTITDMMQDWDISSLKNQVNNIQNRLDNVVSQYTIENHVKVHLANTLNNQSYYQDALTQQKQTFKNMVDAQQKRFEEIEKNMEDALDDSAHQIITSSIKDISNNDNIIQQLKTDISNELQTNIQLMMEQNNQSLIKQITNKIQDYVVIGNLITLIIGATAYYFTYM
jgi:hypothetical protein